MFYAKKKSGNFAAMERKIHDISTYEEALLAIRVAIAVGRDDLLPEFNKLLKTIKNY